MLPINEVVCGDVFEVLPTFPSESIDMIMFSPPYWGLRDYGVDGQMGLEVHPNLWIQKMVDLCRLLRRVLKKSGSLYLNVGDTYFGGGRGQKLEETSPKQFSNRGSRTIVGMPKHQSDGSNWLQPKQLLLMPSRLAIALQEDGWILRNDIVWHKPNHMPSSVKDRLTNSWEHIFHFVKTRRYFYDLDAIRKPHKITSLQRFKRNFNTIQKKDETGKVMAQGINTMLIEKGGKPHPLGKNPSDTITTRKMVNFKWGEDDHVHGKDAYNVLGKNPSDFWRVNTQPFKGAHFAVYPEKICERPIKSSCPLQICRACGKPRKRIIHSSSPKGGYSGTRNVGGRSDGYTTRLGKNIYAEKEFVGFSDCGCGAGFTPGIVLDPMCGSGTTLVVAHKLGRRWIGIELNNEYVEIARKRLENVGAFSQKITSFIEAKQK